MSTIKPENILTLEIRREIYNYILKNPGMHLREISRNLKIPFSTLNYHLNYLEKRELITGKEQGKYNRYYVAFKVGVKDKQILSLIRQDTPRIIILYILSHMYASQVELSRSLEKHPTTMEFHLKKLLELRLIEQIKVEDGIIERENMPKLVNFFPNSKEKIYVLKDPSYIYDLFMTYKNSIENDLRINDFFNFIDFIIFDGIQKKLTHFDYALDETLDFIYDIFPHPYHV